MSAASANRVGRADGEQMMALVERLYPICRSITGNGVRQTLAILGEHVDLDVIEVPSGTSVLDWTVPDEWNVREAWIADLSGRRVVDFADNNLHVVNYSEPVPRRTVSMGELKSRLHSLPDAPDRIPYRTSYYNRDWGFCLPQTTLDGMHDDRYEVCVDATLAPGSLSYGEAPIGGAGPEEFLIYSHTCHPSLCNDNLSGLVVNTFLARALAGRELRHSYRFVYGPGTIGSITWISRNLDTLSRIRGGLVAVLLGDRGGFTYKRSRHGDRYMDRVVTRVLSESGVEHSVREFSPWGYDERQFCSPGVDLAVGRLTRTPNGEYPEYHSSADDLSLVSGSRLAEALDVMLRIVDRLESDVRYRNTAPMGEPQLGRRGLYRKTGGTGVPDRELAMLWVLNLADGGQTLQDIAARSGVDVDAIAAVAGELEQAGLLERL